MIKSKSTFNALVTAALLSAVPAHANEFGQDKGFIPYERLQPEQRILVEEKVKELLKYINIDFKTVVVGLDKDGNLVLQGRSIEDQGTIIASPSCWTEPI
ncbi:MAG: hypothetical protein B7Y39_01230 [Bdellovibrio sp. 28-41-41]|nr:MAG: hypothetical protein B7Y39_01230 [Bdellovibrio sp. 28-41-41]